MLHYMYEHMHYSANVLSTLKLLKHLLHLSTNCTDNTQIPAYLAEAPAHETQLQ